MGPAAAGLDQQSHNELPEKTLGLCESWWWSLRTYAKMLYYLILLVLLNTACHILVFVITVSVS